MFVLMAILMVVVDRWGDVWLWFRIPRTVSGPCAQEMLGAASGYGSCTKGNMDGWVWARSENGHELKSGFLGGLL